MRVPETLQTTVIHEQLRKPPRPRDYWIYDQVVRRKRRQEDVAEDVRLTQERVSQICTLVGDWMDRMWDECVPGVDEENVRAITFLTNLRIRAQHAGLAPQDEDVSAVIDRCLSQLAGIEDEKPVAN